ncbi:MAG: ABC transporter ATP-binding protein [Microthrixaceae bacterium]
MNRRGAALVARFIRTHPMPMAVSVIGAVMFAAAAVGATVAVGHVTDTVITPAFSGGVKSSTVWAGVVLIFVVGVVRGLSVVVRRYFAAMLEARMQATLRRGVVDKYLSAPLSFHHSRPTGELLAHADADVTGTTMLIKPLPFSIGVFALVFFALISLIAVDWTFTLIAIALFPMLTLLNKAYAKRAEVPSALVQQRLGDVSAVAHESFDGALVIKTLGLGAQEAERFAVAADRLRQQRLVVGGLRATFEPILDVLPNIGTIVLFLVGAWRIDSGAVTPGDLVQAASLFSILAFPMRVLGFFLEELPRAVVSVERVDGVLAADDATGGVPTACVHPTRRRARRHRVRGRLVPLRRRRRAARRHLRGPPGRDRRAGRVDGLGQVDDQPAARPPPRRPHGHHLARWSARLRPRPRGGRRPGVAGVPGVVPLRRERSRQHHPGRRDRDRQPTADPRALRRRRTPTRRGGRHGPRPAVHRSAGRRLGHRAGRTRRDPVGRSAPTRRPRPGADAPAPGAPPRRRHVRRRPDHRGRDPRRASARPRRRC